MSERSQAPGDLELIRAFVNTRRLGAGVDLLETPAALVAWLVELELLECPARATAALHTTVLEVREALRAMAMANNDEPQSDAAVAVLNRAAKQAELGVRFAHPGEVQLHASASGVRGALGRLLTIVAHAMSAGQWDRFKACRAEDCRWAYYDHARNRSRAWCSMEVCGNRAKVRHYRKRKDG